ncbi:type I glyceraldehyde-3-phosphate dehydrogenase [Candidatus Woesearchaeota archaeon]|nr:type I glyceraldehyde-3-phosphate dehydrogenase [Candidatus Woesearchaeota archaeon]
MAIRVAINGFGRIGRQILSAGIRDRRLKFIAINDLSDAKTLAHLLRHDTTHGKFPGKVEAKGDMLIVNGQKIHVFAERDPVKLPWKTLKIDVVAECTGIFTHREDCKKHMVAGAKKVLLSAPAKDTVDFMVIYGVNNREYDKRKHHIISNASCTTNCVVPVSKVLDENFGIAKAFLTTVHAYTNTQRLLDVSHKDPRRARAAAANIIPTSTGAAKQMGEVLHALKGKSDGLSMRVPVIDGSVIDLVCVTKKPVTKEALDHAMKEASMKGLRGVLQYSEEPLVSSDIIHNPHSAIYDAGATMVLDRNFIKVIAWYDNEWGFSCRMVDVLKMMF